MNGGGDASKIQKKALKFADKTAKAVAKADKKEVKAAASYLKDSMKGSPVGKGLSALDKFDKRIKVRKVEKEAKPAARAYNARIKAKK